MANTAPVREARGSRLWRWAACAGFTLFTYLTLPFLPPVRVLADRALGPWFVRFLTAGILAAIFLWAFHRIALRAKLRDPRLYAKLAIVAVVYGLLLLGRSHSPIEQIHLVQYGLLGILLHRAIQIDRPGAPAYGLAILIGSFLGYADEVLQGFIQNHHLAMTGWIGIVFDTPAERVREIFGKRFYDPRDVSLNIVSVSLGQVALGLYRRAVAVASMEGVGTK